MNLTEIRERATNYRILLSDPKRLREEQRKSATLMEQTDKAIRKPKRDLSERAHELLDRIDVSSCLEAVRDEAWKEGRFMEFGRRMVGGWHREWVVRLESDPFYAVEAIMSRDRTRVAKIQLQQRTTSLDIITLLQIDRVPKVAVVEEGIYDLMSAETASDFQGNVKGYGLKLALIPVRLENHRDKHYEQQINRLDGFNPKRPLAQDELCLRLDDSLRVRETTHSLPSQIRQWCDEVLRLFPPSLRERGEMTAVELREWGYELRETPRWLRFFDRRLGFLG